ncbi:MAG TPA: flagellar biosynthesis protein FlhB [Myxococcota bacterium]|nr:flagellar biosynthesis protein FlhB [Myxococcota bacterium]
MEDQADKTEPATPKKKEDARKKGNVAQSRDVSTVLLLVAGTAALVSPLGARLGRMILDVSLRAWGGTLILPENVNDYHAVLLHHGVLIAIALAPFALVFMVVGLASNVVQVGWMLSAEALAFKFEKMNPATGLKRMFSVDKLYELAKALVRLTVVVVILWWMIVPSLPEIFTLMGASVLETGRVGGELLEKTIWVILGIFALFAAIDLAWQIHQYEKRLRMSKQEVRDETKQRDGDPKVKSRIRQIQREAAQSRMFESVADADVVVVNPTHYAVALQYRPPLQSSPKVLAKGRNHVALRIRRRAEELGIPIVENPPVAQLLYKTARIDREIPEKLYHAVAEVLAYVYRLDPRRAQGWRSAS